jgi:hypothetical protein
MIKPYVISLDQVKLFLGYTDTTKNLQIETFIPIVSDDLTREMGICNCDFLVTGSADTDGTDQLSNVSISSWDDLYVGSSILINSEDAVISSYDESAKTITLETILSKTAPDQDLYIRNFPYGSKAVVAQMVLYKMNEVSAPTYGKDVASKSIGSVSVSYASNGGFVNGYGYPSSLTKQLSTIMRPRFK